MTFSLYDATVPVFLQILGSVSGLLGKAEAWTIEKQVSDREIIDARLAPDMFPFSFQVKSISLLSMGAIENVRRGQYSPDRTEPPQSLPALKQRIAETIDGLATVTPEEVNDFSGREMSFVAGERRLEFADAGAFLVHFAMPNFMFHATTAYDLLRMKGVPVGKMDFLGTLPLKR